MALDQAVNPDMTKRILKVRTQMVESMYKNFDTDLSESHRAKLYICTLLDPNHGQDPGKHIEGINQYQIRLSDRLTQWL